MPKDKGKGCKKKSGDSNKDNKDDFKRRNSLTDASGTSSSNSSVTSDSSTVSSLEGEELNLLAGEINKGTMTNDQKSKKDNTNAEGSSGDVGIEATLVDRTAEFMSIDPTGNAIKKMVKVVNENNAIPINENTHMKVIGQDNEGAASPSKGSATQKTGGSNVPGSSNTNNNNNNNNNNSNKKKKNQKERKLTKKEKKGKEAEAEAKSVEPPKLSKKQMEMLMKRDDDHVTFQTFDEWPESTENMVVRGVNPAARRALRGEEVSMPFYGYPNDTETPIEWLDGRGKLQARYLQDFTEKEYDEMPSEMKLNQRMGYGIAATGLTDANPKMLSMFDTNNVWRKTYLDNVVDGFNIDNWRQNFAANLLHEAYNRESRFKELEYHMRMHVYKMIDEEMDHWKRAVMKSVMDCNVKQLLVHIAEMQRMINNKEVEMRKAGIGANLQRFDEATEAQRLAYCVNMIVGWLSSEYLENAPEHVSAMNGQQVHVKRGVSVVSVLASSHPGEKTCFQMNHRKCTMLSFILSSVDVHTKKKLLIHPFTNCLTPLHFAAMTGYPCQINVLLKHGSSTEVTSDFSKTPLCFAVRRNSTLMARQLMWHGADLSAVKRLIPGMMDAAVTIGYSSRKFIDERQRVIQTIFDSWLSAILSEIDPRGIIRMVQARSDLHQSRIAETVADKIVSLPNATVAIKRVPISLPQARTTGPVVLFMIPAAYSVQDTTMKAHLPHITRIAMIHEADKVVDSLDGIKTKKYPNGELGRLKDVYDNLSAMKPIELLADAPILVIGDGEYEREIPLKPFLQHNHNGIMYAFTIPDIFDALKATSRAHIMYMVQLPMPEVIENSFFMIQAIEVMQVPRPTPEPEKEEPKEEKKPEPKKQEAKKPEPKKPEPKKKHAKGKKAKND